MSIDMFYEKPGMRLLGLFVDMPFEIYILHVILMLVGVG